MRRIRHLYANEFVVTIGQKISQLMTFSNNANVLLERTWHRQSFSEYELKVHAKFNADTMNGVQVRASVYNGTHLKSSSVSSISIYRVDVDSWDETLVYTAAPTEVLHGVFNLNITQANLGINELSGLETYSIEVKANRKRRKFSKKIWINHLGCFDSLNLLRQKFEHLEIEKADE